MSDLRLLYITCPDQAAARAIADAVVTDRLAACANIIPGMTSIYRWEGVVQEAAETVLILKTREARVAACLERVRGLHPYTTPCIVVLPVDTAAPAFAAWVAQETRKPGPA
jgi:periplasmic divalent cation tolerance protein